MKKQLNFLFVLVAFFLVQCQPSQNIKPNVCYKGTVIGKIRSGGGGAAVSMQKKNFGSHTWRGYKNVVEVVNVPYTKFPSQTIIYFEARWANEDEKSYIITADGDESDKPLIVATKFCN